jgi:ABC-type antimicrobial peptide transport system ATPase subunit
MIKNKNNMFNPIGVVDEIGDNRNLSFIVNNNVKCNISDVVGLETDNASYVLAKIATIKVEFYLENTKQYFISKAVENEILRITDPNKKPRYGQYVTAEILGYYEYTDNNFSEIKTTTNKYTPSIFQTVFSVDISQVYNIYGLCSQSELSYKQCIDLGQLSFPQFKNNEIKLYFDAEVFKKHTLITGVTGSGKSRLAALIVKEICSIGGHVSILDPHNEYLDLLSKTKNIDIFRFTGTTFDHLDTQKKIKTSEISFFEKLITPHVLSNLIPTLSEPQKLLIFETFNNYNLVPFNATVFLKKLLEELEFEFERDHPSLIKKFRVGHEDIRKTAKNDIEIVDKFTRFVKSIMDYGKPTKIDVLLAVLQKVNDLLDNGIFTNDEPNWIKMSPNSLDIFDIDYSTNDFIRRFINSTIQFFLREKCADKYRIIVIDEAHMLLKENSHTTQLIKQFLREARKFNISMIFISQNLDDISDDIRGQFQNQFNFRESTLANTRYFSDRICQVTLCGSKSDFAIAVNEI